jgi:hypothetical protein
VLVEKGYGFIVAEILAMQDVVNYPIAIKIEMI